MNKQGEKVLVSVIGLGNRLEGFNVDHLQSLKPFLHACESLIAGFKSYRTSEVKEERQRVFFGDVLTRQMKRLTDKFSSWSSSSDKGRLFTGRDAVSWLQKNATEFEVRDRDDSAVLARKMMKMKIFFPVDSVDFEDNAQTMYSLDQTDIRHSADKERRQETSLDLSRGSIDHLDEYSLHSLVQQKNSVPTLKKRLTRKKVIECINNQNERGQTALHLVIEREDYEAFNALLQVYKSNTKLDISIQNHLGYTPLHCAAET